MQIVNCLAENMTPLAVWVSNYLKQTLGLALNLSQEDYATRRQSLLEGQASLGFMCGLLYTMFKDQHQAPLEPLVAPVSLSHKAPIYYSYVIVTKEHRAKHFNDLKSLVFCINEQESFSGCQIVRYHLAKLGQSGFFSNVIESGSHLQSIQRVLNKKADSAAIDHTLYEYWAKQNPSAASGLRIIKRLGPFPMPPLVISKHVPDLLKQQIQIALLGMPKELLKAFDMLEFQNVTNQSYDPIREAAKLGSKATLT